MRKQFAALAALSRETAIRRFLAAIRPNADPEMVTRKISRTTPMVSWHTTSASR